jgi:hypothetical protein
MVPFRNGAVLTAHAYTLPAAGVCHFGTEVSRTDCTSARLPNTESNAGDNSLPLLVRNLAVFSTNEITSTNHFSTDSTPSVVCSSFGFTSTIERSKVVGRETCISAPGPSKSISAVRIHAGINHLFDGGENIRQCNAQSSSVGTTLLTIAVPASLSDQVIECNRELRLF